MLPDAERGVHRRLSVLPGALTVQAASAVAGAAPIGPEAVPALLTSLAHRSLLSVVPGDRGGRPTRIRQLATVRAHAADALADAGETDAIRERRTRFIVTFGRPPA